MLKLIRLHLKMWAQVAVRMDRIKKPIPLYGNWFFVCYQICVRRLIVCIYLVYNKIERYSKM